MALTTLATLDSDTRSEVRKTSRTATLAYDGRLVEIAPLWIKSLVLSILTFGFYRFWGRTRLRKYLWSRISLDGDRFEYDGTGGELLRRFLLAVVVIVPVLMVPGVLALAGLGEPAAALVQLLIMLFASFLMLVGYYAGKRYRLSRTLWRGIRGGLGGSAVRYAALAVWTSFLVLCTAGVYYPWQRVRLWRYQVDNTRVGDARLKFDGRGAALLRSWLVSLGGIVVWFFVMVAIAGSLHSAFDGAEGMIGYLPLLVIYSILLLVPAIVARFTARWWSYMASGTRLGDLRFHASVGAWPVVRLVVGNYLLHVLTLGIAWPFVAHRTLKFWCRHLELHGIEALEGLMQTTPPPRQGAEGLTQLFGEGGFA